MVALSWRVCSPAVHTALACPPTKLCSRFAGVSCAYNVAVGCSNGTQTGTSTRRGIASARGEVTTVITFSLHPSTQQNSESFAQAYDAKLAHPSQEALGHASRISRTDWLKF